MESITRAYAFFEFYDEFAQLFLGQFIALGSDKKVIDIIHILSMMKNDLFALETQLHVHVQLVIEEINRSIEDKAYRKN